MNIDIKTSAPTVQVTGIVRAPIDQVWKLFAPFGDIMKWWPIYKWVKLDAPGEDVVGALRSFETTTGHGYREKLVERDDAKHVERYDFVSTDMPISIDGIATTVVMSAASATSTQVTWSSWTEGGGLARGAILSAQQGVYRDAIASLDRHFHPALGTLKVELTSATGLHNGRLFPIDAYALVRLDDAAPQRSKQRLFTSSPVWNETMTLQVLNERGKLSIAIFDANLGEDAFLGEASVDLHTLAERRHEVRTLPLLQGGGGTLTVGLTLDLSSGSALPLTEEQQALNHLATLEAGLHKLVGQAMSLAQQFAAGPEKTYGYARYPRVPALPDVPLEELPRMVKGLPPEEALSPKKLSRMLERGIEYLYSQAQFVTRAAVDTKDPYLAYFGGYVPAPQYVVDHAAEDAELARQFIQGVGPMVIRCLTEVGQVPESMRALQPGGDSLATLVAAKRLFLLDYEALVPIKPYRDMFIYAPLVLVFKEKTAEGARLNLAAIQLTRNASGNDIYVPGVTPPNRWRLAKLHVACADNQYHQWLFHLGFGHLAMEPFAVATHNALPAEHPIAILLRPHFQDTLGINFLARETLVSDIAPFTDRTFSTGTAQALEMFLAAWRKYDFFERAFPAELAARGFDEAKSDGLEGYYFREDGFLVWNAIGSYVEAVVAKFYASDAAVAADTALAAWAAECTDPARADIPGFPRAFASRALLTQALQTLIWSVSAQHSVVNFSQFEFLSYVPNRPDSLFRAMPEGTEEIEASYVAAALPGPAISHFQISFAWLLSTPSDDTLADLNVYDSVFPLRARLQEISLQIRTRNDALTKAGKPPYPFLLPENIAASIAI
ncbi:MAG: lipoxygenase family protein [Deltaproteobacteria bacterium]|jgi:arachidonate 15-lipoxygenase